MEISNFSAVSSEPISADGLIRAHKCRAGIIARHRPGDRGGIAGCDRSCVLGADRRGVPPPGPALWLTAHWSNAGPGDGTVRRSMFQIQDLSHPKIPAVSPGWCLVTIPAPQWEIGGGVLAGSRGNHLHRGYRPGAVRPLRPLHICTKYKSLLAVENYMWAVTRPLAGDIGEIATSALTNRISPGSNRFSSKSAGYCRGTTKLRRTWMQ